MYWLKINIYLNERKRNSFCSLLLLILMTSVSFSIRLEFLFTEGYGKLEGKVDNLFFINIWLQNFLSNLWKFESFTAKWLILIVSRNCVKGKDFLKLQTSLKIFLTIKWTKRINSNLKSWLLTFKPSTKKSKITPKNFKNYNEALNLLKLGSN